MIYLLYMHIFYQLIELFIASYQFSFFYECFWWDALQNYWGELLP